MTVRRRQDEALWRHSNQPIKQPLLKKLTGKEPQSEQAVSCFFDILSRPPLCLRLNGDFPGEAGLAIVY